MHCPNVCCVQLHHYKPLISLGVAAVGGTAVCGVSAMDAQRLKIMVSGQVSNACVYVCVCAERMLNLSWLAAHIISKWSMFVVLLLLQSASFQSSVVASFILTFGSCVSVLHLASVCLIARSA